MPKENKRRGRREEKKRKRHDEEEQAETSKRRKSLDESWDQDEIQLEEAGLGYQDDSYAPASNAQANQEFFGLLDEEEQAYFKRAAQMLELNEFVTGSTEERDAFIAGVWKECHDKEIKVASSQSCSRLMEKLIQYASMDQLKSLFKSFNGHFTYLVQHRFASHCCEALFRRAAPLVTEELITPFEIITTENQSNTTSTESLFLSAVAELQGTFGYLMTDSFASHSVRILLLVLSGRPLTSQSTQALLSSKKKETKVKNENDSDPSSRAVPTSFQDALEKIFHDMVGNLDTNYLRALATHPLGNPVLQLLLEIEFTTTSKQKKSNNFSLFNTIIPDLSLADESESIRFIQGLTYDPIGSHLLETIIKSCPGKVFKTIWNGELRSKVLNMAKNDSSIHILSRAIERLSPEDLQETVDQILTEVPALLQRMQFTFIKLLIERMLVRHLDPAPLLAAVAQFYEEQGIVTALKIDSETIQDRTEQSAGETKDPSRQRISVFFQGIIDHEGPMRKLLLDCFIGMTPEMLVRISKDKYASFVLQRSLSVGDKVYRRIVVQKLCEVIQDLIFDEIGSHLLDTIWTATTDLQFLRERIAQRLALLEAPLRDSFSGRFVWRSWMMDLYTRRKQSWIEKSKQADSLNEKPQQSMLELQQRSGQKTGIEAARERFAAKKATQQKPFTTNMRKAPQAFAST